ncbi:hypothetical protein DFA_02800 [Cavenderia fasciculata]|uniref:Uncharacterized protein n=1 Tax=Cavenderia fasciculata TaxID=261658 RepID=F4PIC3_CACFS|nr:uncharacterized protein DFA_02800 [Cavenderia fasciculata]EGG24557.1 hypothetical protein DFA_02800 [Cavenderia fasciculata]|eukprot:XP_004362408.1 hypothetical protein DFA_02800 [Cavenderia fasciculata]
MQEPPPEFVELLCSVKGEKDKTIKERVKYELKELKLTNPSQSMSWLLYLIIKSLPTVKENALILLYRFLIPNHKSVWKDLANDVKQCLKEQLIVFIKDPENVINTAHRNSAIAIIDSVSHSIHSEGGNWNNLITFIKNEKTITTTKTKTKKGSMSNTTPTTITPTTTVSLLNESVYLILKDIYLTLGKPIVSDPIEYTRLVVNGLKDPSLQVHRELFSLMALIPKEYGKNNFNYLDGDNYLLLVNTITALFKDAPSKRLKHETTHIVQSCTITKELLKKHPNSVYQVMHVILLDRWDDNDCDEREILKLVVIFENICKLDPNLIRKEYKGIIKKIFLMLEKKTINSTIIASKVLRFILGGIGKKRVGKDFYKIVTVLRPPMGRFIRDSLFYCQQIGIERYLVYLPMTMRFIRQLEPTGEAYQKYCPAILELAYSSSSMIGHFYRYIGPLMNLVKNFKVPESDNGWYDAKKLSLCFISVILTSILVNLDKENGATDLFNQYCLEFIDLLFKDIMSDPKDPSPMSVKALGEIITTAGSRLTDSHIDLIIVSMCKVIESLKYAIDFEQCISVIHSILGKTNASVIMSSGLIESVLVKITKVKDSHKHFFIDLLSTLISRFTTDLIPHFTNITSSLEHLLMCQDELASSFTAQCLSNVAKYTPIKTTCLVSDDDRETLVKPSYIKHLLQYLFGSKLHRGDVWLISITRLFKYQAPLFTQKEKQQMTQLVWEYLPESQLSTTWKYPVLMDLYSLVNETPILIVVSRDYRAISFICHWLDQVARFQGYKSDQENILKDYWIDLLKDIVNSQLNEIPQSVIQFLKPRCPEIF